MTGVYYNDNDPQAAEWLRTLMAFGQIPFGFVDERSILDVEPADLASYHQCHFFAGIGGWAYALQLADWPTDRPVWTGSPPCQPFSAAGRRISRDDPRHLAPKFASLVGACRPPVLFGEQVASADVFGKATRSSGKGATDAPEWAWLDDLSDRLEAAHYAVGASDFSSAGVGAPHIRQRTFFGAVDLRSTTGWLQHASGDGRQQRRAEPSGRSIVRGCDLGGLGDAGSRGSATRIPEPQQREERITGKHDHSGGQQSWKPEPSPANGTTHPTNGFWGNADWLRCRDDKWWPVEPGTFPLADRVPGRVGLLRGYGNAINPWAAKVFIEAFREVALT